MSPEYADRGHLDPFFHEVIDCRMADLNLTDTAVAKACGRSSGWVRTLRLGPRTFLPTPRDLAALADALDFTGKDVQDLLIYSAGYGVTLASRAKGLVSSFRRKLKVAA